MAVEIKRIGTIEAVEQLTRYLERIRRDPAMADCHGVLAAQVVKPQARVLAEARGLACVEVDLAVLRGEREPALTLVRARRVPPMSDDPVLTERRDGVLLITLNRPEARNAVNAALAQGVAAALDELDADDELEVGVLTGAGGSSARAWTSRRSWRASARASRDRGFAGITQRAARKPLIAAIEGFARRRRLRGRAVVRPDRRGERRAARHPRGQARAGRRGRRALRLPRRIPYHLAMELALTGDPIGAERAHAVGLVNRLAEPGAAVDAALELAAAIARNGPLAVDASKQIVSSAQDWTEAQAWQEQAELAGQVLASEDAREGATAFAEKREPVWKGR